MIAIRFNFVAGRYHATPWGRHVNEGLVEWPPSPWRLLRSLVASYHRKAQELSETQVRQVVEKLAIPPLYQLPSASLGHSRHFMPQHDPLGSDRTKVFDAFASPAESLMVFWPQVVFEQEEMLILQRLLTGLGYLGRAESWVEAELVSDWDGECNCSPLTSAVSNGYEVVSILAPMAAEEYLTWSQGFAVAAESGGKRQRSKASGGLGLVPTDLWTALHAQTGDLQKQGWSMPPGSRWVDYLRPINAFKEEYRQQIANVQEQKLHVARFVLTGSVLPRFTDALSIGERMRKAVMSKTKGVEGSENALAFFAGRGESGEPLQTDNTHTFYLPADDDGDGRLDHITVYLPSGFDEPAKVVLGKLRKLWGAGGHDLFLALTGVGKAEDFGGFNLLRGETPQLATSRIWDSCTPYLLSRHPKIYRDGRPKLDQDGKQVDGPEAQLRLELKRRELPEPISVEPLPTVLVAGKELRWMEFRRARFQGGGKLANPTGYGFRLVFDQPVIGPLALGYGCHFGLGQFVAVKEATE